MPSPARSRPRRFPAARLRERVVVSSTEFLINAPVCGDQRSCFGIFPFDQSIWSAQVEQNLCQRDFWPLPEREPLHLLPKFWAEDGKRGFVADSLSPETGQCLIFGHLPFANGSAPGSVLLDRGKAGPRRVPPPQAPRWSPALNGVKPGMVWGLPELCTEVMATVLCNFAKSQKSPGFLIGVLLSRRRSPLRRSRGPVSAEKARRLSATGVNCYG